MDTGSLQKLMTAEEFFEWQSLPENDDRFFELVCAATVDAATTPDAGPDRMVSIGRRRAVAMLSVPPLLLVMYTGAAMPNRWMRSLSFAR